MTNVLRVCEQPVFRRFWYPVLSTDDLADDPVAVRLLGENLVLWRPEPGAVSGAVDRCPHRYARLSGGWLDCGHLVCPYHGWEYGSDGVAVRIPQLDASSAIPSKAHLSTVNSAERYGWVWVCLDNPLQPIPEIAEFDAEGWRAIREPESAWACPAPMIIENNLDPAHIAFVHRASFGSPESPHVPIAEVTTTPTGLQSLYEVPVQSRPGDEQPTTRRTTTDVIGPLLAVIRIDYPDGVVHTMIKACTPVDDTTTLQFQTVLRSDSEADRPAADILAFDAQVWEEDREVLEPADPEYPLDLVDQVHLRVDRPSIEYRRMLARLVDGE